MNLEGKLNAHQIVIEIGMSARPEFYSGRGAISCDLNDQKLEKIYEVIEHEHGKEAAQNYAQMVADIPVLSATDFLLSLYKLEAYEWKWDKKILGNEKGIEVGSDYGDGRREAIAEVTVLNVLSGISERNETEHIRGRFLKRHGIKTEKPKSIYDPVREEY